jgi:hypothetical protein
MASNTGSKESNKRKAVAALSKKEVMVEALAVS